MTPPSSGIARVAEVPRAGDGPCRIWIEDRLYPAVCASPEIRALSEHDLVRYRLGTDSSGLPLLITSCVRKPDVTAADVLRWRLPDPVGKSRIRYLQGRDRIERLVRAWFAGEGFIHIPAPVRVRYPNPEPQFAITPAGEGCLITSPELQLKRLLVGGLERIYSLVPCFRGGETDRTHNPEFTMLEWYRTGAELPSMADDLERMLLFVADGLGDLCPVSLPPAPWPRKRVDDLIREELGLDIGGCVDADDLLDRGQQAGLLTGDHRGEPFEVLFSRLWSLFEGRLGGAAPLFITGWPLPLASLAAVDPEDPTRSLRMELVYQGVELANGFAELTDPLEQRRRMEADVRTRSETGKPHWVVDARFLEAVDAGLPEAAGMALGFERLCMLLLGAGEIRSVLPFIWEEL